MMTIFLNFGRTGLILFSLSVFQNAIAHPGMHHESIMHSVFHIVVSVVLAIAVIAASFVLLKRLPKAIKLKNRK